MNNTAYIIIYKNIPKNEGDFIESIAENFLFKRIQSNSFILISTNLFTTKEVYEKLFEKNPSLDCFVVKMDQFYGNLEPSVWVWIKEKMPHLNYTNK